jgi:hypothetical protein
MFRQVFKIRAAIYIVVGLLVIAKYLGLIQYHAGHWSFGQ